MSTNGREIITHAETSANTTRSRVSPGMGHPRLQRVSELGGLCLDDLAKDAYSWLVFVGRHWGEHDAEDLAQEALLRALTSWSQLSARTRAEQRAWLKKVAYRHMVDLRRRRMVAQRAVHSSVNEDSGAGEPDQQLDRSQARDSRHRLVASLDDEDRRFLQVWMHQHARESSREDAAAALGLTVAEYEAGKKRVRERVLKAAKALDLEPADLLTTDAPVTRVHRLPSNREETHDQT